MVGAENSRWGSEVSIPVVTHRFHARHVANPTISAGSNAHNFAGLPVPVHAAVAVPDRVVCKKVGRKLLQPSHWMTYFVALNADFTEHALFLFH